MEAGEGQETWGRLGELNNWRSLGDRGVTETEEPRGARNGHGPEVRGSKVT